MRRILFLGRYIPPRLTRITELRKHLHPPSYSSFDMICYDVQVEPALQPITGEELARGTNQAPDARLDVHCRGFWERQRAAFFDIRVCHPNADSYRDLSPKQIYRIHENEKKRKYNSRVTEIEQGTFTPLVFTTTGGMADECLRSTQD